MHEETELCGCEGSDLVLIHEAWSGPRQGQSPAIRHAIIGELGEGKE